MRRNAQGPRLHHEEVAGSGWNRIRKPVAAPLWCVTTGYCVSAFMLGRAAERRNGEMRIPFRRYPPCKGATFVGLAHNTLRVTDGGALECARMRRNAQGPALSALQGVHFRFPGQLSALQGVPHPPNLQYRTCSRNAIMPFRGRAYFAMYPLQGRCLSAEPRTYPLQRRKPSSRRAFS